MSRWRSIWLVAKREILERGRSRGFLLSVLFTTVLVIGSFVLPSLLFGEDEPRRSAWSSRCRRPRSGHDGDGRPDRAARSRSSPTPTRPAAAAALDEGDVAAVVAVPADLSTRGDPPVQGGGRPGDRPGRHAAVIALRVQDVLAEAGVDPAAAQAAQQAPAVDALDTRDRGGRTRFLFANIGAVLILVGIFSFGFTVLTGVVEEKQSRVVEVVLSTVRARDLLMGKVLGIGILGLFQLGVFVVAALAAAVITDRFVLPPTTPSAIVLLAIWFILGYTLYSTALGFLGALASRMEEASNASTPVTMVAMISYFVAIFAVVNDPSGPVAHRDVPAALGAVRRPASSGVRCHRPIEIVVSILVTLVGIWALFVVGARVYAGAVLQTGGRMKLRDAWRSAGE